MTYFHHFFRTIDGVLALWTMFLRWGCHCWYLLPGKCCVGIEWRCVCGCGLSILEILNVVVVCLCWNAQSLEYVARTFKMIARTLLRWSRRSEDASLLPFRRHSQHGFKTWDLRTTWVFLSIVYSSSWLSSWSPQIWTAQIHVVIKTAVINFLLSDKNPRSWWR